MILCQPGGTVTAGINRDNGGNIAGRVSACLSLCLSVPYNLHEIQTVDENAARQRASLNIPLSL